MKVFEAILSFLDFYLYGPILHIKSIHRYQEPVLAGNMKFIQKIHMEYRALFSDRLVREEIVFRAEGKLDDVFYLSTGERWIPPTVFYSALHDFEFFMDRAEDPLRQEKFEQILREED